MINQTMWFCLFTPSSGDQAEAEAYNIRLILFGKQGSINSGINSGVRDVAKA